MKELLAKLRYRPNNFEIIEEGNYVICAVFRKKDCSRASFLLEC